METTAPLIRQIAEEIKAAMLTAGMSQRALAEATGLPLVTLSRRLTGAGKPFDLAELALVAAAVNLSLVELIMRAERTMLTRPATAAA